MNRENFKRKLSCILSADVAGYSRLMEADEESTVRILEENKRLIGELIEHYSGRVVDSPGDNLLAEFGSIIKAVDCAVEIQKELKIKNTSLPESRQMHFRIGINLGDVIEEDGRIYGSGVNIAARIEGFAQPGGICISGTAYDHIKTKYDLGYEYLGEHRVKNINHPVGIYRIHIDPEINPPGKSTGRLLTLKRAVWVFVLIFIPGTFTAWYFFLNQSSGNADIKKSPETIAVLPFEDLSPGKKQGYFVDGLSEEILNSLTKLQGLNVIGRTSSFSFKGSGRTVQEIAGILGADHILEGSVRKEGNKLRINTKLLLARDGVYLWSETYNRELKGIFEVQENIAKSVANELKVTLGIDNIFKHPGGTGNSDAYELFLIARGQYDDNRYREALDSIDAAIGLDPAFADVWALKGMVHIFLSMSGPDDQASFQHNAALEAALKAVKLEPDLGRAHLTLGSAYMMTGRFIDAEKEYKKGIELTTEAIDYFEYGLTWHYAVVGYLRKCNELLREMRQKDPLQAVLRTAYFFNLGTIGEMERAEKEYESGKVIFGEQRRLADTRIAILRLGSGDSLSTDDIPEDTIFGEVWIRFRRFINSPEQGLVEVRSFYDNNETISSNDMVCVAIWAAYFGGSELSMNAIEKSVSLHATSLHDYWAPLFHKVRQLPRFKEFARKIGLVDYWNKYGWPDLCQQTGGGYFECN